MWRPPCWTGERTALQRAIVLPNGSAFGRFSIQRRLSYSPQGDILDVEVDELEEWVTTFPMARTHGTIRLGVRLQPRVVVYPNGGVELGGRGFRSVEDATAAFAALLNEAQRRATAPHRVVTVLATRRER